MIELGALKSTRWRHDGHLLLKKSRPKLKNQLQCGEGNTQNYILYCSGQIIAIHTLIITKPVNSHFKLGEERERM